MILTAISVPRLHLLGQDAGRDLPPFRQWNCDLMYRSGRLSEGIPFTYYSSSLDPVAWRRKLAIRIMCRIRIIERK